MDRPQEILTAIDAALERFGARDLISSAEVVDFLLDLRLLADWTPDTPEELDALLGAPAAT